MVRQRKKFRHWFWIAPLILIAATSITLLVALVNWLEGAEFRSFVERMTTDRLHAKTELAPLRWVWTELTSGSLRTIGSAQSTIKRIESSGVHARMRAAAVFEGKGLATEIELDRMEVHLGPITALRPEVATAVTQQTNSLPKWLPAQFVVERIRSASADVMIEQPKGGSIDILGTTLESVPEGNEIRFEAHGGRVVCERFPDLYMTIDAIRCRLSEKGLDLTGADLAFQNAGSLRLDGNFPSDGSEARLKGHWEAVTVTSLLPALEGKVLGSLRGHGETTWGRDGIHKLSGDISAHDVTLSGLPGLEKLAMLTGMDQFRHLPVQEAHATFCGDAEKTQWRDIVMESKGLLKLMGEAEVARDGSLRGTFQVGITKGIVSIVPYAREVLGLNEHDGMIWTPMMLEGSISHPKEDLTPRLATVLAARMEGIVKDGIQEGLNFLGLKGSGATNGTVTNAVKTIEQDAGKVLDTLGGFLK
jgi:hypothetical protein